MSSLIVEVCKIDEISKHPNADKLSIVGIKGWHCIVGLDEYKPGDLAVYIPPDSIVPEKMANDYKLEYLKKNGRVRTVKLRKCVSQGLVLPIPEGKNWKEGKDVANHFGITKWEPPAASWQGPQGKPTKKKANPNFAKYTDIENVKNFQRVFQPGDMVVITEKIHGTNFRAGNLKRYTDSWWGKCKAYLFGSHEFVYGSHNIQLNHKFRKKTFYGEDVYGKIAKKYDLANILPKDHILYGEIYGANIQDLNYGKEEIDVVFFDMKVKDVYVNWRQFATFCKEMELPMVPILTAGVYLNGMLEEHTKGKSTMTDKHVREGCVVKSIDEAQHYRCGRKILKSINEDYLLRKGGTEFK